MGYVEGVDVKQMMMASWDDMVDPESIARLIDAFVDSLDLQGLGFQKASPAEEGRPAYDPGSLLKLYLYGTRNRIRSSRRLAHSCLVNLEVIWLVKAVQPDFRTISDFRKDNIDSMKKVFHEFNRRLAQATEAGFQSVDGSKFRAWNSKDRNFTLSKLDDRIKRIFHFPATPHILGSGAKDAPLPRWPSLRLEAKCPSGLRLRDTLLPDLTFSAAPIAIWQRCFASLPNGIKLAPAT